MISASQEDPLKIIILSRKERKKAQIDPTISLKHCNDGSVKVEVGNTGLQLIIKKKDGKLFARGDFMPGGYTEPGKIGPIDALKIFSYGMVHLRAYLLNTKEIDYSKIVNFVSKTNKVFSDFLTKLFSKTGHENLIDVSEEGILVNINIQGLINLSNDDELIILFNKFSKRAEEMEFDAMVPVEAFSQQL